jgi:type II secretory pathway component PulF
VSAEPWPALGAALLLGLGWLCWPAGAVRSGLPWFTRRHAQRASGTDPDSSAHIPASRAVPGTAGLRWRRPRDGPPSEVDPGEVAACLDLIALTLGTGCAVIEAVQFVAHGNGTPAGRQLAQVAAAVRWGLPWSQAWQLAGPVWSSARSAMAVAEHAGVGPAGALQRAAHELRERHTQRAELAAARLGVRIVLPLGLTFLPAFVLLSVVPIVLALAADLV